MNIYVTKVWGFGEPCSPLQFSQKGRRDSDAEKLKNGDLVILVGTLNDNTDTSEQGLILGMMEPSKKKAVWSDFKFEKHSSDYDEDGDYRWPYSLLNKRAWVFDEPRIDFKSITKRVFRQDAAQGIVLLNTEEAEAVLMLPRTEISLMESVRGRARIDGNKKAKKRFAPPPTTTRRGAMHMRRAPAHTYLLELVGANEPAFKIGWAFDYGLRAQHFNDSSMPSLGGLEYKPLLHHLCDTAMDAFKMEQRILKHFDDFRHRDNREILTGISYSEIEKIFIESRP